MKIGLPPELREERALKPYALDPLRVGRHGNGRDRAIELEPDRFGLARVEMDLAGLAVEIPGRDRKVLALPLIHVELDDVAVGAVERRVDVQHPLNEVVAGGEIAEPRDRIAVASAVDHRPGAGAQSRHVLAEERSRRVLAAGLAELEARLGSGLPGQDDEHASIHGLRAHARRERELETERGRGLGAGGRRDGQARRYGNEATSPN